MSPERRAALRDYQEAQGHVRATFVPYASRTVEQDLAFDAACVARDTAAQRLRATKGGAK